jgi:choline-glycine betaine transporter
MSGTGTVGSVASLSYPLSVSSVLSGGVLLTGFFFPETVHDLVPGGVWLVVAVVFFTSCLGYLAVLPFPDDHEGTSAAVYVVSVLRFGSRPALRSVSTGVRPGVLLGPVAVALVYVSFRSLAPSTTAAAVDAVSGLVSSGAGGVVLGSTSLAVVFGLVTLVGPWGKKRLGGPDAEPTYTYPAYFALIFTAGIAAGVVFSATEETLIHYDTAVTHTSEASTQAVTHALVQVLFHWGLSAWSVYAVFAIPIAYFVYERGAPLRVSTVLTPVVGVERLDSPLCSVVDGLAVFATLSGVGASVVLTSEEFLAGIVYYWNVTTGIVSPALLVVGMTLVAVASATTGIHRGVRRLAGVNVLLFAAFGVLLTVIGPTEFVLAEGARAVRSYAGIVIPQSVRPASAGGIANSSVWNFAWWFAWAPFMGLFVAAVSRGRRIRSVVFTSVLATSAVTVLWFLLVGGTSLWVQHTGRAGVVAFVSVDGVQGASTFAVLGALPAGHLFVSLFFGLVVLFVVSSMDVSTLVVAVLATRRGTSPSSEAIVTVGLLQGAVAAVTVVVGGQETLRAFVVLAGSSFALVSLVAVFGLCVTLYRDERGHERPTASSNRASTARGEEDASEND